MLSSNKMCWLAGYRFSGKEEKRALSKIRQLFAAFMVSPGDRIAVLTSGRSDNLQNFKGAINAIALQLNDGLVAYF